MHQGRTNSSLKMFHMLSKKPWPGPRENKDVACRSDSYLRNMKPAGREAALKHCRLKSTKTGSAMKRGMCPIRVEASVVAAVVSSSLSPQRLGQFFVVAGCGGGSNGRSRSK